MKHKTSKAERETPITDGDTRPDENIDGTTKANTSPIASDKKKITRERGADVNSMDDYKDANK